MHKFTLESVTVTQSSMEAASAKRPDVLAVTLRTDGGFREPKAVFCVLEEGETRDLVSEGFEKEYPYSSTISVEVFSVPEESLTKVEPIADATSVTPGSVSGPITVSPKRGFQLELEVGHSTSQNAFPRDPEDTVHHALNRWDSSTRGGEWIGLSDDTVYEWISHVASRRTVDEGPPWKFSEHMRRPNQQSNRQQYENLNDYYEPQQDSLGYCVPITVEFWMNRLFPRRFVEACRAIFEHGVLIGNEYFLAASGGLLRAPPPAEERKLIDLFGNNITQPDMTEGDWMFTSFLEENDDLWNEAAVEFGNQVVPVRKSDSVMGIYSGREEGAFVDHFGDFFFEELLGFTTEYHETGDKPTTDCLSLGKTVLDNGGAVILSVDSDIINQNSSNNPSSDLDPQSHVVALIPDDQGNVFSKSGSTYSFRLWSWGRTHDVSWDEQHLTGGHEGSDPSLVGAILTGEPS